MKPKKLIKVDATQQFVFILLLKHYFDRLHSLLSMLSQQAVLLDDGQLRFFYVRLIELIETALNEITDKDFEPIRKEIENIPFEYIASEFENFSAGWRHDWSKTFSLVAYEIDAFIDKKMLGVTLGDIWEYLDEGQKQAFEEFNANLDAFEGRYPKSTQPFVDKIWEEAKAQKGETLSFDKQTGVVAARGRKLIFLSPTSREYHFFALLYKQINHPCAYEKLMKTVLEKLGKRRVEKDATTFCHDCKSVIKKKAVDAEAAKILADLIVSTKTSTGEKGYMLKIEN